MKTTHDITKNIRGPLRLCAIWLAGALAFSPNNASAAVAFKDVWYPDGTINYYITDDAEKWS